MGGDSGYILHGAVGTGSFVVEAALLKAGAPHTLVNMWQRGDKKRPRLRSPPFVELNPKGQVPVLVLPGGEVVTESAAILLHLAAAFPEAQLAPAPGTPAHATFLRHLLLIYDICAPPPSSPCCRADG